MFIILQLLILFFPALIYAQDLFLDKRERMVTYQIERRGIDHIETLKAMRTVKRHLFVPENYRKYAYDDGALPIGYGQTISQPYMVGYMTQLLDPKPESKMLEVGFGSGYQSAVLAEIIDSVFAVEIIPELGQASIKRLGNLGYKNVQVKIADGYYGWEEHSPFDAIIVTAAAEYIPPPLVKQLKDGGKMVIPVGSPFMTQMLMLVEKKDNKVTTKSLFPVRFVPFRRSKSP